MEWSEADWNVKKGSDGNGKSTYGFKAHLNVDEDGLIKATDCSSGSSHDSNHFLTYLVAMNQQGMRTARIKVKHMISGYQNEA